jgi:epoxide hydrolase 4
MPQNPLDPLEFARVSSNGVSLHVARAGPADGRLVLLLHGFPEFWYSWRSQIPALAQAGFRVWAPDQRGYNLSEKPRRVGDYRLETLAADVVGLIKAAGVERADVVGHDWGGAVAWQVAMDYPDCVRRLVVLNCPHPRIMRRHLLRSPRQMIRSSYILAFQVPWLPERLARFGNGRPLIRAMQKSSRPGTFSTSEFEEYRKAWSMPGAMRSMLNWYRALVRHPPMTSGNGRISVPTLLIWGAKDKFLGLEMAQPSIDLCDRGRLVVLDDATHWVQHEDSLRVNDLLVRFLSDKP